MLKARPKKPVLSEDEEKEQAVKNYLKQEHNKKVDARREKLGKVKNALKKTGNYLSETKLAEQSREKNKKNSGRYLFEEKNDWF